MSIKPSRSLAPIVASPECKSRGQLFVIQHDFLHRAVSLRPTKSPSVQFFRTNPKTASVIYEELQAVVSRICEQKNMAARGIAFQPVAHQTVKTVESRDALTIRACSRVTCRSHRFQSIWSQCSTVVEDAHAEPSTFICDFLIRWFCLLSRLS